MIRKIDNQHTQGWYRMSTVNDGALLRSPVVQRYRMTTIQLLLYCRVVWNKLHKTARSPRLSPQCGSCVSAVLCYVCYHPLCTSKCSVYIKVLGLRAYSIRIYTANSIRESIRLITCDSQILCLKSKQAYNWGLFWPHILGTVYLIYPLSVSLTRNRTIYWSIEAWLIDDITIAQHKACTNNDVNRSAVRALYRPWSAYRCPTSFSLQYIQQNATTALG
jgi:hypothetical protein